MTFQEEQRIAREILRNHTPADLAGDDCAAHVALYMNEHYKEIFEHLIAQPRKRAWIDLLDSVNQTATRILSLIDYRTGHS